MAGEAKRGSGGVRWGAAAVIAGSLTVASIVATAGRSTADERHPNELTFSDSTGVMRTITTDGAFDDQNPFFQSLGTNGRSCATCHQASQAWTVTPEGIQARFEATRGLDPIFRTNDGSNCEGADVSTLAKRRSAFKQLLTKGLLRIDLTVPARAEFEIVDVDDPYNCGAPFTGASLYRRPLPATNLGFLSAVMWDGRETVKGQSIAADLHSQAIDATTGHAQGATPSDALVQQIVDFEMHLFTAQTQDGVAGGLNVHGAQGGPLALSTQSFCDGVNDPLGILPVMPGACATASTGLDTNVFTLFAGWNDAKDPGRQAIARGEQIFNSRTFVIDGVAGLNGGPGDPVAGPIAGGTCTVCHNTPNAGDHSVSMPLNVGVADAVRRTANLPLYTLQNTTTHAIVQTTDPGRAMITGNWADIGKFKGPILRALAARAPYFHNGSADTLADVVDFYDTRFNIGLTAGEKSDLIAFLRAL
jgi:cytochrome c peroxidase